MAEAVAEKRARKLCYTEDPETAVGWQCRSCGTLYSIRGHDDAEKLATECCNLTCRKCGTATKKGFVLCDPCRKEREFELEKAAFNAAKKVSLDEYRGKMLYAVGVYFEPDAIEEVQKGLEEENREQLAYAWACSEERPDFNLGEAVDDHLHDNHGEACGDNLDSAMLDAAQILVDEAIAECVEYKQRTDLAVLLPPYPQEHPNAAPEREP